METIEAFKSRIREISGEDFADNLLTFCNDLEKDQILTFGFIIYDETTPEFRKILRDKDYWEALDRASGDKMMVFALSDKRETKYETDNSIQFLTAFNQSRPSKTKSYSHILNEVFRNESLLVYPSILFFQVYQGEIYDVRFVPLKRGDVWNSMHEVQKLLESIAKVLTRITPENYGNRREIFE